MSDTSTKKERERESEGMWHTYIACNSAVYQRQYLQQQHRVKCMPNAKGAQGKSRSGCQRDKTRQDRGTGATTAIQSDRQTEVTKFNTQVATQTTLRSVKVAAAAAAVADVDYF